MTVKFKSSIEPQFTLEKKCAQSTKFNGYFLGLATIFFGLYNFELKIKKLLECMLTDLSNFTNGLFVNYLIFSHIYEVS